MSEAKRSESSELEEALQEMLKAARGAENSDREEALQEMLNAARRVLERERGQLEKRREIARRFEELKAAWQEGGVEKMREIYEDMARNPAPLDPPVKE